MLLKSYDVVTGPSQKYDEFHLAASCRAIKVEIDCAPVINVRLELKAIVRGWIDFILLIRGDRLRDSDYVGIVSQELQMETVLRMTSSSGYWKI